MLTQIDCPLLDDNFERFCHRRDLPVVINYDALLNTAHLLAHQYNWPMPVFNDPAQMPTTDSPTLLLFLLIAATIDFDTRRFDEKSKTCQPFIFKHNGETSSGSSALYTALRANQNNDKALMFAPKYLANLSMEDMRIVFEKDSPLPQLDTRKLFLVEIGDVLLNLFDGRSINILNAADYHAFAHNGRAGIIDLLTKHFSCFAQDVRQPNENALLRFYKRAQLFVLLYHACAIASCGNLIPIKDIKRLGPIVDYRLPQILHQLKILKYDQDLESRVQNHDLIKENSLEEIAIRSLTAKAVVRLLETINLIRPYRRQINMVQLDNFLWTKAHQDDCKTPAHISNTRDY